MIRKIVVTSLLADTADAYLLGVIAAGVDSGNVVGTKASPIALTASNIY